MESWEQYLESFGPSHPPFPSPQDIRARHESAPWRGWRHSYPVLVKLFVHQQIKKPEYRPLLIWGKRPSEEQEELLQKIIDRFPDGQNYETHKQGGYVDVKCTWAHIKDQYYLHMRD